MQFGTSLYGQKYIRVEITQPGAYANISHQDLIAWIMKHGWKLHSSLNNSTRPCSQWVKNRGKSQEVILIPETRTFIDYTSGISRAVKTVARVQGISELDIYEDLGGQLLA